MSMAISAELGLVGFENHGDLELTMVALARDVGDCPAV